MRIVLICLFAVVAFLLGVIYRQQQEIIGQNYELMRETRITNAKLDSCDHNVDKLQRQVDTIKLKD